MPTRNKVAGNTYERTIVHRYNEFGHTNEEGEFVPLFPAVGTSRDVDRFMDNEYGVDITTPNRDDIKEFGLLIQAKNKSSNPQYPKILNRMQKASERFGCIPVIYHWQTQRVQNSPDTAPRFMKRGEFAILNVTDFESIWTKMRTYKKAYEEFIKYMDGMEPEVQEELNKFFNMLNL